MSDYVRALFGEGSPLEVFEAAALPPRGGRDSVGAHRVALMTPRPQPSGLPPMEYVALNIAIGAHAGQLDKQGKPYIDHVLRVVEAVQDGEEQAVAALHDVIEDTPVTLDELRMGGFFPPHVIDAVDAITRRDDETYSEYITRVARNDLARTVKIADLRDNLSRGAAFPSLCKRYRNALAALDAPALTTGESQP